MTVKLLPVFFSVLLLPAARAQLATTAWRALGQPDLRQNALNRVEGVEMNQPGALALDPRPGRNHLYVADTANHRVLGWRDARSFQSADPPELVLGQPTRNAAAPLGIGPKGLRSPGGLAVDGAGNLYVSDTGNHRVLRFASPFDNPSRREPNAVYGQPDFATALSPAAAQNTLRLPRAIAFDGAGNLWIADTAFHRLLRYPAATLDSLTPVPDQVVGQADFTAGGLNRGRNTPNSSGFDTPAGIAFDAQNNLYVSDYNNDRVLRFPAVISGDIPAVQVFGQPDVNTRLLPSQTSAGTINGPAGLAVDSAGNLHVAVPNENRVLVFSIASVSGSPAKSVLGQGGFSSGRVNADSFPFASANSLATPTDVKVDSAGNVFVADSGNHRLLAYSSGSRSASRVLGQNDFSANGANQVKAGGLNAPFKVVVDYSQSPFALYVSDTGNHRILIWKDAVRFRTGAAADLAIGQPDLRTAVPNVESGIARRPAANSLASPKGIALDQSGNLYVADSENNRVLRYPRPVAQQGRIAPDLVLGQFDFTSADSSLVSARTLRSPSAVAVDPDGNIFVSDSGNHRVLMFPANSSTGAAAVRVMGQPDFTSVTPPDSLSSQTLFNPQGIAVDAFFDLFVADSGSSRVVVYLNTREAPIAGASAAVVLGGAGFDGVPGVPAATRLRAPADVALDASGRIYVSDAANHRVVVFPPLLFLPETAAIATDVAGQKDLGGVSSNWNSQDGLATPEGLSSPSGIFVDRQSTLYVADTGNSRVLHFLKSAAMAHVANPQASAFARGSMAAISGSGLSDREENSGAPFPGSLGNREVTLNDEITATLASVGPDSILFQVPWLAPTGSARFAVRRADTGELIAGAASPVASYAPELFTVDGKQGVILNEDGSKNSQTNPAGRGSYIKLTGTGQGQVSPLLPDGGASPDSPPALTVATPVADGTACLTQQPSVCVAIGDKFGEIRYSGLAPGQVGIWQLEVKIPTNASPGPTVQMRALIGGALSNIVTVAIR